MINNSTSKSQDIIPKMQVKVLIKKYVPTVVIDFGKYFLSLVKNVKQIEEDISSITSKYNLQLCEHSIIIGNGPSFQDTISQNIDFFENKTIFCVNNFVSSSHFEVIKPKFYVFADPAYWNKNCSQKLIKYINEITQKIIEKVDWQIFILLPISAKKWNWFLNLPEKNKNIKLCYYNNSNTLGIIGEKFNLYKKNKAMPSAQTVLVAAIFISLNLKFKINFVVGGDLSIHETIFVNKNNIVCLIDKHFYDENQPQEIPFWKNEEETITFTMAELFQAFSKMFSGFQELEDYSKYLGSKIYNASHKSYIDAFERYDLEKRQPIHES